MRPPIDQNIHQIPFIAASSSWLKARRRALFNIKICSDILCFIMRLPWTSSTFLRCPIPLFFIQTSVFWVQYLRHNLIKCIVDHGAPSQLLFFKWHWERSKSDSSLEPGLGRYLRVETRLIELQMSSFEDRPVFELTFSTSLKNLTSLDTRASLIKLRIRTNISILIILLVLEGLSLLWYCKSWNDKIQILNYEQYVPCLDVINLYWIYIFRVYFPQ